MADASRLTTQAEVGAFSSIGERFTTGTHSGRWNGLGSRPDLCPNRSIVTRTEPKTSETRQQAKGTKEKREPFRLSVFLAQRENYTPNLRRAIPRTPNNPVPSSASDDGSGTGEAPGLAAVDAEKVVMEASG